MGEIQPGDRIKLLSVPEWLTHDLPADEVAEIRGFVGREAVVEKIDAAGYFWIGFGATVEAVDEARYAGHSFGVPRECVERV